MGKSVYCNIPPRIFLVNKPKGLHSGDVVKHFKYHLPKGFGKIGHLGTLDPFAEGLLLIAVGQAARLSFLFQDYLAKTYEASGIFHHSSSTGDSDGEIIDHEPSVIPSFDLLSKYSKNMEGLYKQAPPHFSASKYKGKPLYAYAREGILINKEPVNRYIHEFCLINISEHNEGLHFRCKVSSGTYIRTLFEDYCALFNTRGYLDTLNRVCIGELNLERSLSRDDWPNRGCDFDVLGRSICPTEFFDFPSLKLEGKLLKRFENGQRVAVKDVSIMSDYTHSDFVWLCNEIGVLRGLCKIDQEIVRPSVIFPQINDNI